MGDRPARTQRSMPHGTGLARALSRRINKCERLPKTFAGTDAFGEGINVSAFGRDIVTGQNQALIKVVVLCSDDTDELCEELDFLLSSDYRMEFGEEMPLAEYRLRMIIVQKKVKS